MAAMVSIREYFDRVSADLACSSLQAAGIKAVVLGDDMGGMRPDMGIIGRVRVLVPEPEKEEALALLDELERQRPQLVEPPEFDDDHKTDGPEGPSLQQKSAQKMTNMLIVGVVVMMVGWIVINWLASL